MKKKYLLITGGTGGHVIPAVNFGNYLLSKNISCEIVIDKRGYKYIDDFKGKIHIINSSNLFGNILKKFIGLIFLFLGFIQSFFIILNYKPNIILSFGSYASFSPMISCLLLKTYFKIELFLHEQNSVLGRTNKFFLMFSKKLFLNFDIISNLNNKIKTQIYVVGSPEKNIMNLKYKTYKNSQNKFTIFIYGGSQGSEYITNFSINLIKILYKEQIINANFILQCPKHLIEKVSNDLKDYTNSVIIKDYFKNIEGILENSNLAISRAGAGSISDLINFKVPSVLIPLPSSKDNHQYYNASIMFNHGVAIIVDQNKDELNKVKDYIYKTYSNKNNMKLINKQFDKIKVKNCNSLIYNLIENEK